jgi:hypothetical protein
MLDNHIDPDTLAAFAAKALSKQESARLFAHLAACEHCRDCLRLHSQLSNFPSTKLVRLRAPYFFWQATAATACALAAFCLVIPIRNKFEGTQPTPLAPMHAAVHSSQRRTFTFPSDPTHPSRPFKLPAPLAAASLANNLTFFANPAKPPLHTHQIALQTSLGERWIALDMSVR